MINRRQALLRTLFGLTGIGLRSFATGIPVSVLLNPRTALASEPTVTPQLGQFLIFSTSSLGDPVNANVPGTYLDPKIAHPAAPAMAATTMAVGGTNWTAAKPWASLPLARTSFFHHATNSIGHSEEAKTLRMGNGVNNNEMLVSMLAAQLAPALGTIQREPLLVGVTSDSEVLTYQGRPQPKLMPSKLATVLTMPNGPLKNLRSLRDQTLDSLNAWYKKNATPGQLDFLARYANSGTDLRAISDSLLNGLTAITDDGVDGSLAACIALIQLNVAPVLSVHIPFGGDNHTDDGLADESDQTVAALASLASLQTKLQAAKLEDKVTFANLNVFGRTLGLNAGGGRDHNPQHHVTVMVGKNVKSSVVGGVQSSGGSYSATGINSTTGAAAGSGGDVPFLSTFPSMGKTLARAVGLTQAYIDTQIGDGKTVAAAVVS